MAQDHDSDTPNAPTHPRCAECGVPMWLVRVKKTSDGDILHFECKVCDATLVRPASRS